MIQHYHRIRKKRLKELSELTANIVKKIIEAELGELPIPRMEDELAEILEEWIDEFDSEKHLAWKLETGKMMGCCAEG